MNILRSRNLSTNPVGHRGLKGDVFFLQTIRGTNRRVILAIFFLLMYALPALTQSRKVFTVDDIVDLIKNGVKPNRVAQLVEEHGVAFELDDRALRRLKQEGANDAVLSAVKKMSARYTEERQQVRRQQEEQANRKREEVAKRTEEERRTAEGQKRQQAKVTQEPAKNSEEERVQTNSGSDHKIADSHFAVPGRCRPSREFAQHDDHRAGGSFRRAG